MRRHAYAAVGIPTKGQSEALQRHHERAADEDRAPRADTVATLALARIHGRLGIVRAWLRLPLD